MWFFTLDGMLSIVRHRDYADRFLVRSRSSGVLERCFPEHPLILLEDADYRYRVIASWEEVLHHIMNEMETLLKVGYTDYKGACRNYGDSEFNHALALVWETMRDYQVSKSAEVSEEGPRRS